MKSHRKFLSGRWLYLNVISISVKSFFAVFVLLLAYIVNDIASIIKANDFALSGIHSKSVVVYAAILSFLGVYAGVLLRRFVASVISIRKEKSKFVFNADNALFIIVISSVLVASLNIYPYMSKITPHQYDAFTIIVGLSFFFMSIFVSYNPYERFNYDVVRVRINTFGRKKQYGYMARNDYKTLTDTLAITYILIDLGIVLSHMNSRGIINFW